jgi:rubrerythrin
MLNRLKRLVRNRRGALPGREQDPRYECQDCGTTLEAQRQECPGCGGYHIGRAEW